MNKTALAIATAIGIITSSMFATKAVAAPPPLTRPYEWTIEIDTQEMPNQFKYAGSSLNQVVKAQLQYYAGPQGSPMTKYETLWYSNAQSLGLERQSPLQIKQGDAIAITVIHNSGSAQSDEQRAAGKAVMKAVLDANLNKNMVATIIVPMSSFNTITQEIQNYHFTPISAFTNEDPNSSDMNLYVVSSPAGMTQGFAHVH